MEGPNDNDERREPAGPEPDAVGGWLRRLARGLLFDAHGAEDAVQDAWVAALSRRERPGGSAWFGGAVRNLALGKRRDDARRRAREHRAARPEALPSAADAAARIEVARRVLDAVERLDEPYRAAVLARFFDGEPPRAIARRHGVPVNTARTWVRRGLERLRRDLDPLDPSKGNANAAEERGRFLLALAPLAGPAPWPITLGLSDAAWRTAAKWTGGLAMGKAFTGAAVAAVVVAVVIAVARGGSDELRDASTAQSASAPAARPIESEATTAPELASDVGADLAEAETLLAERAPAPAATPSWNLAATALRGYSEPFPDLPVVARIFDARQGATPVPLAEQRLVAGEHGALAWRIAAPEHAVTVEFMPDLDDAICYPMRVIVPFGEAAPTGLLVRAYPLDVEIVGRVTDADGAPLHGVTIGIYQDREQTQTGADGTYRARSSSTFNDVTIYARLDGFAAGRTVVHLLGEAVEEAETLVLERELRVVGRVTDPSGEPIEGAEVANSPLTGDRTHTDADGRYALRSQNAEHGGMSLFVTADGYARAIERILLTNADPGDEIVRDVVLERGAIVRGVVTDAEGVPLDAVQLTLGYAPNVYPRLEATSGPDGAFAFPPAAEGERTLWAERAGLVAASVDVVIPATGELEVDLELLAGGVVTGRVVDTAGAPIPFAPVAPTAQAAADMPAWDGAYLAPRTHTDADGRFRFDRMPDAPFALEAFPQGFVRETVEVPGLTGEPVEIVLRRANTLAGRVVDAATGAPLEHFTIRLVAPSLREGERRLWGYSTRWSGPGQPFERTHGRFEVNEELVTGTLIGVEASAPGYAPSVNDRVRVGEAADELVFALGGGATVRGRVVDEASRLPIAGAFVRRFGRGERVELDREARGDVSTRWDAVTDANGRFEMAALPLGASVLAVRADGYPDLVDEPFDAGGHGAVLERELVLPAGATITGLVVDAEGVPQAGELVYLFPRAPDTSGLTQQETRTDADGR